MDNIHLLDEKIVVHGFENKILYPRLTICKFF